MALHLTTATRVREPGFSQSECLELARRIDHGDVVLGDVSDGTDFSQTEVAVIVAALRAYADV